MMAGLLLATCMLALVCASNAFAQVPERHTHTAGQTHAGSLGEVAFENSGAAAAQEPFLRGLALLHSFEYDDAAEAFREAQRADESFALAFYGEALTYAHLVWGEDDPAAARAALSRLAATPEARVARTGSERERAYAAAIEALFIEADLATRVRGFADAMRGVSATYSDDVDAAAFTALALMFTEYVGVLPADQRRAVREDAIALAERAFALHPKHPGALHYLIHATDEPEFAARGERAARSYAEIAPDAEHALHMPSHIFLQLGRWDEVVASNERAWAASRADVTARGASNTALSFHALQWLQYGYLQQGRFRDAHALVDTARNVLAGEDLSGAARADARFTAGALEFMYATNTGDWSRGVCAAVRLPDATRADVSDRERTFRATALLQAAVTEVKCTGEEGAAARALRAQAAAVEDHAFAATLRNGVTVLDALAMHTSGALARAIDLLTPLANAPQRPPVGPPPLLRVQELLADALLKKGQPAEAAALYERALQLTPNRSPTLLGLSRARAATGDTERAAAAYGQLLANWHRADTDSELVAEVRSRAASR